MAWVSSDEKPRMVEKEGNRDDSRTEWTMSDCSADVIDDQEEGKEGG